MYEPRFDTRLSELTNQGDIELRTRIWHTYFGIRQPGEHRMYGHRFDTHLSFNVNQGDIECPGPDSTHICHHYVNQGDKKCMGHIRHTFVRIRQPGRHSMYGPRFGTHLSYDVNQTDIGCIGPYSAHICQNPSTRAT